RLRPAHRRHPDRLVVRRQPVRAASVAQDGAVDRGLDRVRRAAVRALAPRLARPPRGAHDPGRHDPAAARVLRQPLRAGTRLEARALIAAAPLCKIHAWSRTNPRPTNAAASSAFTSTAP